MKKSIVSAVFVGTLFAVFILSESVSYPFFFGVGSGSSVNKVIKDGQSKSLIPTSTTPPSGLACNLISTTQIDLAWADNSSDETGFQVERKTGSAGSYTTIATSAANAVAYSDSGLTQQTTYYYRLRAITAEGLSKTSNEDHNTTWSPVAPTGLAATPKSSNKIDLAWVDNSDNETGFKIERKTGSGSFTEVTTVAKNVSTYSDTGLSQYTAYVYRVRAYNVIGDSAYTAEVTATTERYTWLKVEGLLIELHLATGEMTG